MLSYSNVLFWVIALNVEREFQCFFGKFAFISWVVYSNFIKMKLGNFELYDFLTQLLSRIIHASQMLQILF